MNKLGQMLLKKNVISLEQLQEALIIQKQKKKKLGETLIELGFVKEQDILLAMAEMNNLELVNLNEIQDVSPDLIKLLPYKFAIEHKVVVIGRDDNTLIIAVDKMSDIEIMDNVKKLTGYNLLRPQLASEQDILNFINKHYRESLSEILHDMGLQDNTTNEPQIEIMRETDSYMSLIEKGTSEEEDKAPVIKIVNQILMKAVENKASDIHLEPSAMELNLRNRIDGVLYEDRPFPKKLQNAIISRIKVMAGLDITEHRLPQDGRKKIKMNNREVDLRISILPTIFGEKIVIRLLDPSALFVNMDMLGLEHDAFEIYKRNVVRSHGIILVTGPTGSGKTTTLYSTLDMLNDRNKNIITIEDPVEYVLKGINQVQTNAEIGLTFAEVLRSILRQDPNVIMIGEIRDLETAQIATNAALTGHLVLSTMHTNNTPTTITRLLNLGIDSHLIASTLMLTVAQRLLRKVCNECKQPIEIPVTKLMEIGISQSLLPQQQVIQINSAKGCQKCFNTGYKGRIGVYEVLEINEEIGRLISHNAGISDIKEAAIRNKLVPLRQDAILKLLKGVTTIEEVLRVTDIDYA